MSDSLGLAHVQPFDPNLAISDGMKMLAAAASDVSPLMTHLTLCMADDPEVLALLASLMDGQLPMQIHPVVNYLLAASPEEPLREYYACYTPDPLPLRDAYPVFREFCLRRQEDIRPLLATRTMQLTFPERAAPVLIALNRVAEANGEPIALVEVGCSAGLLLRFDQYHYDFGAKGTLGDGPITIRTELKGPGASAPHSLPPISQCVGIELHPIDLTSGDECAWILASLPPDRADRHASTSAALQFAREHPARIVAGDAVALLEDVCKPLEGTLCVLNSHCIYQWPLALREAFEAKLLEMSRVREVHHVSIEIVEGAPAEILHRVFAGGRAVSAISLGRTHNFGDWIELD